MPDERIARWAARGSEAAFAVIFERHHQALHRYCHTIVGNSHDASDALQSTMLKAFRALPGETREIALRPWLYRIAHNESISLLRARRPDRELHAAAHIGDPSAAGIVEARDRMRALAADLNDLTEQQRGALLMRELGGLSFAEIAGALEISPAAAKQTVYESRCVLQALKEGREMECDVVRRTLSDGDRRALRGKRMRGHLQACAGCHDFERALHSRPGELAALAPPLPMGAAAVMLQGLIGGGGGFGAGGGLVASLVGGAKGIAGASLATQVATVAVVGSTIIGGSAVVAMPERFGSSTSSLTASAAASDAVERVVAALNRLPAGATVGSGAITRAPTAPAAMSSASAPAAASASATHTGAADASGAGASALAQADGATPDTAPGEAVLTTAPTDEHSQPPLDVGTGFGLPPVDVGAGPAVAPVGVGTSPGVGSGTPATPGTDNAAEAGPVTPAVTTESPAAPATSPADSAGPPDTATPPGGPDHAPNANAPGDSPGHQPADAGTGSGPPADNPAHGNGPPADNPAHGNGPPEDKAPQGGPPEDKAPQGGPPEDKAAQAGGPPEDKAAQANGRPEDKTAQTSGPPADKPAQAGGPPEDKAAQANGRPEDKTAQTSGPPADKPAQAGGPPADHAAQASGPPADKPAQAGGPPADKPAPDTDKATGANPSTPAAAQDKPAAAQDKPAASQDKPAAAQEKPAATQEKPVAAQSKPAAQDKPAAAAAGRPATTDRGAPPSAAKNAPAAP